MNLVIFKGTHGMIQERTRDWRPQMETLGWGWSWLKSPKSAALSDSELRQLPPSQGNLRVENPLPPQTWRSPPRRTWLPHCLLILLSL